MLFSVAPGAPYHISDLELASRLSFFLWSSVPDDTLLQLVPCEAIAERTSRSLVVKAPKTRDAGAG